MPQPRRICPGRKAHAFLLGAFLTLALSLLAGCGRGQQGASAPSAEDSAPVAVNPDAKPVDPSTSGSITGVVKLEGAPPRMRNINMRSVSNCQKTHETPATTEDVLTGDDGGLRNVVVYLRGDFSAYSFPAQTAPVDLDQKGCLFVPHVLALTTQTPLSVRNSDETTHNTAAISKNNRDWNQTQSIGGAPLQQVFARPEVALALKCNIHPWMKAYVAVFSHPYFQVTGQDGAFTLKNVPPGTYTVSAWHERYGTAEQMVTLSPKGEQVIHLSFKAA